MPKIVDQDTPLAKRATCRKCGAINEYMPNEVRELSRGGGLSGVADIAEGFNCGQCGKEIVIEVW